MAQKVVDIKIKKLDITQLVKMHHSLHSKCSTSSFDGAYLFELRELLTTIIKAGYNNQSEVFAPDLTI
jgi:hypothetical protein